MNFGLLHYTCRTARPFALILAGFFLAAGSARAESNTTFTVSGTLYGTNILYIGNTGTNNSLIVTGGGRVTNNTGYIGNTARANGNSALVTGTGSVWFSRGNLYIGYSGSVNRLTVSSGGRVVDTVGYIGYDAGASNNSVLVTGDGSVWSNRVSLYVGRNGSGCRLAVSNGGQVVNGNGYIGAATSAVNNSVLVTGARSLWSNRLALFLGQYGSDNNLTVSNGGRVVSGTGYIGYYTGANSNSALVTGNNSVWSNSGLLVGVFGSGNHLTVSDGGQMLVQSNAYIGWDSGNNTVLVEGEGSVWSNRNSLYVGHSGSANSLILSNGGRVVNTVGYIGYNASSKSNSVLVTGDGSVWSNRVSLYVGRNGSGNSLTVSNGGRVVNGNGYIGAATSAVNNSVLVTGARSLWSNRLALFLGQYGSDNNLTVSNGGRVVSGTGYIGYYTGANSNSALVTGNNSVWSNSSLLVGVFGSGNHLTISDGGQVMVNRDSYIGWGSESNSVLVTGTGSVWSSCGNLSVGNAGNTGNVVEVNDGGMLSSFALDVRTGNSAVLNNGSAEISGETAVSLTGGGNLYIGDTTGGSSLEILNGGRVAAGSTYIGRSSGADLNTVAVSGSGSQLAVSDLHVGYNGTRNTVTVSGGGHVSSSAGTTMASSYNRVTVTGIGSTWNSGGLLDIGFGNGEGNLWEVTDYGYTESDSAIVRSNATLRLTDGMFHTAISTVIELGGTLVGSGAIYGDVDCAGRIIVGEGSQIGLIAFDPALTLTETSGTYFSLAGNSSYDRIDVDGNITFAGTLNVEILGGFAPELGNAFNLFDWGGSASGTFSGTVLPALSGSLRWSTDRLYTEGIIEVVPEPAVIGLLSIGAAVALLFRRLTT